MNILVTGATGFIGKHLCARLERNGHTVIGLGSKDPLAHRLPFDQIWHLAAWTQAGTFCLEHPAEQWLINQRINLDLLSYWREFQPQAKLISFGTSCAYDYRLPRSEDNYLEGKPIDDLMAYAMSKRMLQVGIEAMGKQYGMKWLTLIPATVYGPGYHNDGRQLHFIYDLVRKILEAKRTGEPPVLWGDGEQVREIVHVSDLLSMALSIADSHEGIYNVCGRAAGSIRFFAKQICELVEYDSDLIKYDRGKYVGDRAKILGRLKTIEIMCGEWTPLQVGLAQIIAEMEKNQREEVPADLCRSG